MHPLVAATVRRLRPVTADGRVGRLAAVAGAGLCLAVLTAVGVSVHPRPLSSPSIPAPPPTRAHTTTEPRSAAPELAAPPAVLDPGPPEIAAAPAAAPAGTTGTAEHRTASVVLAAQRTGWPDRAAQARTDQPGRADGRTAETAGHDPDGDSGSSGDSDSSGASDSTKASGSSGDSDSSGDSNSTGASDSSGDRGGDRDGGDRDGANRDHRPLDRGKDSTSDLQEHSLGSLDAHGGDVAHDDEATVDAPVAGIDASVGDAVDSARDRGGDAGRAGERTRGPAAALPAVLDGSALDGSALADHDGRG